MLLLGVHAARHVGGGAGGGGYIVIKVTASLMESASPSLAAG